MSRGAHRRAEQRWIITFADLAAVLLAFFVMMFAMSEVDRDQWDGAVQALSRRLHVQSDDLLTVRPQADRNVPVVSAEAGANLTYLAAVLEQQLARDERFEDAELIPRADRLVLSLPASSLFEPGRTRLQPNGRRLAFLLSGVLAGVPNKVAVVAHTDASDVPSWQASLESALVLRAALRRAGFDRALQALAQGVGPDAGRSAAHRVDIVILEARDIG